MVGVGIHDVVVHVVRSFAVIVDVADVVDAVMVVLNVL